MRKILFIAVLMLIVSTAHSTVYHVAASGGDFANIAQVNAATFASGDQILFNRGEIFSGTILIQQSGTIGNPIVFGAYGTGANPIITGFTTVTAWTSLGGNIWESTNTVSAFSTCNMVVINGVNTAMGRYPNSGETWGGYLPFQSHSGSTSITTNTLTGTPDWTGAEVVIRSNRFIITRSIITSQSAGTLNFLTSNYDPMDSYGFFIQNDTRTLDAQNEWYYNPITHKIQVYSIAEPTNVKVSSTDKLFTFNNDLSYITIENLSFTGANTFAIYEPYSAVNHVTIQNCDISFSGKGGLNLVGNNCWVENNTISYSNNNAVDLTNSQRITFKGNTVQNSGELAGMGVTGNGNYMAIVAINKLTYGLFENNRILNTGFNGMYFYGDSITVKNNFVDTFCNVLDDGGGIYTYTGGRASMVDVKIINNIIINGTAAIDGRLDNTDLNCGGIYMDDNSANIEVGNNTIYNCNNIGIVMRNTNGINLHDNTVFDNDYAQLHTWDDANGGTVENNIITGNKFFARDVTQYVAIFKSSTTNIQGIGVFTLNYYARPIDEDLIIKINTGGSIIDRSLAGWQEYSGHDINSVGSPFPIVLDTELYLAFNADTSTMTQDLPNQYKELDGTPHAENITLDSFDSRILFFTHKLTKLTKPTMVKATNYGNQFLMKNGNPIRLPN